MYCLSLANICSFLRCPCFSLFFADSASSSFWSSKLCTFICLPTFFISFSVLQTNFKKSKNHNRIKNYYNQRQILSISLFYYFDSFPLVIIFNKMQILYSKWISRFNNKYCKITLKIEKIYYKFLSSNLPSLLGKLGKPHYLKFVKLKDI